MVVYILCIALVNLGLGYGLALYLHGQSLTISLGKLERLRPLMRFLPFGKRDDREIESPEPVPAAAASTPAAAPVATSSTALGPVSPESSKTVNDGNDPSHAFRSLATATMGAPPASASSLEAKESSSTSLAEERTIPAPESPPAIDEAVIASAIEDLRAELGRYRGEIASLDARLRDCALSPGDSTVRACADDLRRANSDYLVQQKSRRQRLASESIGDEQSAELVRQVTQSAERQAEAVSAAQTELAATDLEADLLIQCEQLLKETHQIAQASEEFDSIMGTALAEMAGLGRSLRQSPSTSPLDDREEFRVQLDAWRSNHPDAADPISVAMIDPDHLNSLNERYTRERIDRSLAILEHSIAGELPKEHTLVRSNSRTRLYLLPKLPLRDAVNFVERHRQQIEATRFKFGGDELRITVSCAVAESEAKEGHAALIARLEAMLHEAKRYGRNRSFFQESGQPSPAVPPVLRIDGKTVQLDAVGV